MGVAVSTAVFDGHPLNVGLDTLADMGVRWVEPAFIRGYVDFTEADFETPAAKRLARAISERGLCASALSAHMNLADDGAVEALRRRISCASTLGAPFLITNAGPKAGEARIKACIEAVIPALEDAGITLALENPGHGSGDLAGTASDACALVDDLGADRVGLNVDVGNFATYLGGVDPMPEIRQAMPRAVHVHLKDYRADGSNWIFTALGEGSLNFPAILEATGGVPRAIELPLRLRRPGRKDPVREEMLSLGSIRESLRRSIAEVTSCVKG